MLANILTRSALTTASRWTPALASRGLSTSRTLCEDAKEVPTKTAEKVHPPSRQVFIGNVPRSINTTEIVPLFQKFGEVESVKRVGGSAYMFVTFKEQTAADAALKTGVTVRFSHAPHVYLPFTKQFGFFPFSSAARNDAPCRVCGPKTRCRREERVRRIFRLGPGLSEVGATLRLRSGAIAVI
ncbi:hypothetical protein C8R43DRAFT_1024646 [Mycena crocata]|nr:hypothetical protein C8R43DRAFT_1024646 [Mycena crocata]